MFLFQTIHRLLALRDADALTVERFTVVHNQRAERQGNVMRDGTTKTNDAAGAERQRHEQ